MGWELHAIATFAGHRSTDSTLRYIHLSGRELSEKLSLLDVADPRVAGEHAHRARAARVPGGDPGVTAAGRRRLPSCGLTARLGVRPG